MGGQRDRTSGKARGAGSRAASPSASRELPDFTHLPERIPPDQLRTSQDVDPGPDPLGGRDTETEFMLRNAGF